MSRYLVLWRANPDAPWPKDPTEMQNLAEQMYASIEEDMKKGNLKDWGHFVDRDSGYTIVEGDAAYLFNASHSWSPYIKFEAHETVSFEKARELERALKKTANK